MPRTFKSDVYKQHVHPDIPQTIVPHVTAVFGQPKFETDVFPSYTEKSSTIAGSIGAKSDKTEYKYSEDEFLRELQAHVDSTYTSHYGGQIQPVEFIMSNAETLDYLKGNVVKYIYRFGKKDGSNRKDLMKACHFIMMMARYGDKEK